MVLVALVLNGTNIYGYMRCRWNSSESDPLGTITSAVGLQMLKSVSPHLREPLRYPYVPSSIPVTLSFAGLLEHVESLGRRRQLLLFSASPKRTAATVHSRHSANRLARFRWRHCFQHCLIISNFPSDTSIFSFSLQIYLVFAALC